MTRREEGQRMLVAWLGPGYWVGLGKRPSFPPSNGLGLRTTRLEGHAHDNIQQLSLCFPALCPVSLSLESQVSEALR